MERGPMTQILIVILAAALLNGSRPGQVPKSSGDGANSALPTSPATVSNNPRRIEPGSVIRVQLAKSIDGKKAKQGDEVVAKVAQDLRNDAGTIVVPKDTKFVGRVTRIQTRTKEQKESAVTINFDHAVFKTGETLQIATSIQAIIASLNRDYPPTDGYPGAQPVGTSPSAASHQGPMEGQVPATSIPATAAGGPASTGTRGQPQINGNTQGVVGLPNLKVSAAPDATQGSVVSSEKNNVRLEEGTILLLRVN
jgi:hypothetical protein